MNTTETKTYFTGKGHQILAEDFSLYQRNLASDASSWLRKVEGKAKQLKTGKVILVAIFKQD